MICLLKGLDCALSLLGTHSLPADGAKLTLGPEVPWSRNWVKCKTGEKAFSLSDGLAHRLE